MVVSVLPSGVGATSSTKAWMGSLALAVATAGNSLGQTVWPILHEGEGGARGEGRECRPDGLKSKLRICETAARVGLVARKFVRFGYFELNFYKKFLSA